VLANSTLLWNLQLSDGQNRLRRSSLVQKHDGHVLDVLSLSVILIKKEVGNFPDHGFLGSRNGGQKDELGFSPELRVMECQSRGDDESLLLRGIWAGKAIS